MERASQIAEAYRNGNRNDARAAVLASERPDLMALDVLTELVDIEDPDGQDDYADIHDSWRRCLAGGL